MEKKQRFPQRNVHVEMFVYPGETIRFFRSQLWQPLLTFLVMAALMAGSYAFCWPLMSVGQRVLLGAAYCLVAKLIYEGSVRAPLWRYWKAREVQFSLVDRMNVNWWE